LDNAWGVLGEALTGLGALLEAEGERYHLLAVGGVAINLRGIRSRTTADVDVIARLDPSPEGEMVLLRPAPFPEVLQEAIQQVAADLNLEPNWLNTVVAAQWDLGLPPWTNEDIEWHDFGGLQLGVVGRRTLIASKLYAATDQGPKSVHTQDLLYLAPTDEELEVASAWVATQYASEAFAFNLREVVAYVTEHRCYKAMWRRQPVGRWLARQSVWRHICCFTLTLVRPCIE
jgi:hypothetical protein